MTGESSPAPSGDDLLFLRQAIALSLEARDRGRHPFAALVVDEGGRVIATAMNESRPPDGDPTRHAELVAVAQAARALAPADLRRCTLYTSAEPCAMCAGAAYWCGVGRVVYALSEQRLLTLTGSHPENPTLALPCREVFAHGQRTVQIIGPTLEDEAAQAHEGFWS
ncbi:nucleoside deaminase [Deinococcus sp. KSM4-11]|uniref:nucleoside deaminase n=1 Tax=Deinococcus sp. KSM4-11 TaxID=2568654 RepID=UPI0010A2ECDF|nr:nucleoside deaminase [Deinococcus sp. KSM4-11]THF87304.1 nucleoside deaminase [Deinococcus sp. KSM4-11]